ncbi:MAG TPA: DUF3566 domain-containing protein, partial [Ilumatobacter sp.]|nr:DUF3566 domain-containing protein [Ilumatobacter sp.]
ADDGDQPMPLPTIVLATEHDDDDTQPHAVVANEYRSASAPAARTASPVAPDQQWQSAPSSAAAKGWGDYVASPAPAGASLRAPGRRPRVRRVTRVLRHIDPWSTFKVALLFSLVGYVVTLTSGVLLWRVADSTGTLDNVERWFTQFGWETFELKGGEVFHNAWVIGLFGAIALTGGLVLLATLFNLVSDIVGGVRVTVLEEEVVERTISSTRRYVVRQPPSGGVAPAQPAVPDWTIEGDSDDSSASPTSATKTPDTAPDTALDLTPDTAPDTAPDDPVGDWSVDDD